MNQDHLYRLTHYPTQIKEELEILAKYQPSKKDILIVVHNGLAYLRLCIESIRRSTEDYELYIWDNGSDSETRDWLREQPDIHLSHNDGNLGFIIPNNNLIKLGDSPYVVLLNSDTIVRSGWDMAMIAYLQQKPISQIGYVGGWLNHEGLGKIFGFGDSVDYISGWCFCIPREIYNQFGLFDECYEFAYCEDADFSMRITEAGHRIHALHLALVDHLENQTIRQVADKVDCRASFDRNHAILRERWKHRLGFRDLQKPGFVVESFIQPFEPLKEQP